MMSVEVEYEVTDDNKPKKGEFYSLGPDMGARRHGVVFENEEELLTPPRIILQPQGGGFPPLKAMPRLRHIKSKGAFPLDLESSFSGYWMVSQPLKEVFEQIDPEAFAFAPCLLLNEDGTHAPPHFLCDVIIEIDALNEETSRLQIKRGDYVNGKFYYMGGGASITFRPEVLAGHHVFRTPFTPQVFCDRFARDTLIAAGFGKAPKRRGLELIDAVDY